MKSTRRSTRAIAVLVGFTLGATTVPILSASATAAVSSCRLPGGVITINDLGGRSATACGAVGRLVDAGDGVTLPIPPPGGGVTLGLLRPDGSRTYTLTTDTRGLVTAGSPDTVTTVQEREPIQGFDNPDEFPDTPGVPGACERDTYALAGFKWYKPWLFRTTVGTTLATEDQRDFDAAAMRATINITRGRNTCGLHGGISAVGAFAGHTTTHGNFVYVGDQTTCGAPDSRNVLDEGDLPGGFREATLAAYCVWTETRDGLTRALSADLRFNGADYNWTDHPNDPSCQPALPPDPVRWRYDVESVLTHEVGHVFGLVNLSADEDINLTMYPGVRRCSGHFRTLGLGDVLGMRALY
jgi:hypothetical protein